MDVNITHACMDVLCMYLNIPWSLEIPTYLLSTYISAVVQPVSSILPIARFIWNAEISVSVAIHCYERLF